jgi:hypothetical protein
MAKATLIPAEPEVQLTLSKAEAQTLVDVMSLAGGSPLPFRCQTYANNIMDALGKVGYHYNPSAHSEGGDLESSRVYFHSEDQFEKPMGGSKS